MRETRRDGFLKIQFVGCFFAVLSLGKILEHFRVQPRKPHAAMKYLPTATLLLVFLWACVGAASIKSCACWDGYRVEQTKSGPQCLRNNLFHVMPCDMPKTPRCRCSGRASNILKDKTGTWCTRYRRGEELTRWPCENAAEWSEFFRKHPDFVASKKTRVV